jgi:hypothetical protein
MPYCRENMTSTMPMPGPPALPPASTTEATMKLLLAFLLRHTYTPDLATNKNLFLYGWRHNKRICMYHTATNFLFEEFANKITEYLC